jgi:hypothetical protein
VQPADGRRPPNGDDVAFLARLGRVRPTIGAVRITMTRSTNGFSKKWENHRAALCLVWLLYFCRIHQSIQDTPATNTGIVDNVMGAWELLA